MFLLCTSICIIASAASVAGCDGHNSTSNSSSPLVSLLAQSTTLPTASALNKTETPVVRALLITSSESPSTASPSTELPNTVLISTGSGIDNLEMGLINVTDKSMQSKNDRIAKLIIEPSSALRSMIMKKKGSKKHAINSLLYQEMDDTNLLLNEFWMYNLEDVSIFFKTFLDTQVCIHECEGYWTPRTTVGTTEGG